MISYIGVLDTGQIVSLGMVQSEEHASPPEGATSVFGVVADPNTEYYDFEDNRVKRKPDKPSPYHDWNWIGKQWVANVALAKESKLREVNAEIGNRLYEPCNGFDADRTARERITGMIARLQRGDGLPPMWAGWRDTANQMHWVNDAPETVLEGLKELSRAIEDREQALLVTAWNHKANIQGLQTLDEVLSYSIEF